MAFGSKNSTPSFVLTLPLNSRGTVPIYMIY